MTINSACLPNTASYTFNGDHVGGQAIFESVHQPLSGGGRARRSVAKRSGRAQRRVARRSSRSQGKSRRRVAKRSPRSQRGVAGKTVRARTAPHKGRAGVAKRTSKPTGRRAVYRTATKMRRRRMSGGALAMMGMMAKEKVGDMMKDKVDKLTEK